MTFKGKGAFWGIVLAALLLVLTYVYSERIRDRLKEKKNLFFIVPVILLACFALLFINSCNYVPMSQRTAENPVTYAWEQVTGNDKMLSYTTDAMNPATGSAYSQTYAFKGTGDGTAIQDHLIIVIAESNHVFEEYNMTTEDGRTEITFYPDGNYIFHVLESGEIETGTYEYADKSLTMTKADGTTNDIKLKKSAALNYISDVPDPSTESQFTSEFSIKELRSSLPSEGEAFVGEAYSILSKDERTELILNPDGTYRFVVKASNEEETGTYTYQDKALTLTRADGESSTASKTKSSVKYKSALNDPETVKPYTSKFSGIDEMINQCVEKERLERVSQPYTAASADGSTTLTFSPDGTYLFADPGSGVEEPGHYMYTKAGLIMANSEGSDAFRKNFSAQVGWLFFAILVAIAMALVFIYQAKIKKFLNRHPMIWLLIPAALLIYFVYVAIGWNLWVSVSDWQDGSLTPSYGWGGFGQYTKMFHSEEFWGAVLNTLKLFLIIPICLLLGLGLALVMDQGLKGTSVFRTLILLPFALSFVVTGLIWQQMFTSEQSGGILAGFFKLFGVSLNINWMSNELVMISIMLVMVWQFSGYVAVIFLAAIKNVPTNIINAAKLDGAYMPRVYWKMILPQMKGAMGSCITILAMYALRSFDLIYSLTSVTNNASKTLPIMMYVEAFSNNNSAYAAAISCFLLAMVLVLILPLTYLTNRRKK